MPRNEPRMERKVRARLDPLGVKPEPRLVRRLRSLEAANRRLRESKERSEETTRAKSELISRTHHELVNQLNLVIGFGQVLETSNLSPHDRECLDQILMGGRRLLELAEELQSQGQAPETRTKNTTRSNHSD